jgi:hypothetical protein
MGVDVGRVLGQHGQDQLGDRIESGTGPDRPAVSVCQALEDRTDALTPNPTVLSEAPTVRLPRHPTAAR